MTTAYLYSPVFLEHKEFGHPESPERLTTIMQTLDETGLRARLTMLEPIPATDAQLQAAHTRDHIAHVKNLIARGGGHFDADTYANARSLDAARLAAGAVVGAVDAVMAGSGQCVRARPPAGTPRDALARDGFLSFQQHRYRRTTRVGRAPTRPRADCGLRRASRQRHARYFLSFATRAVLFDASISALPRHRSIGARSAKAKARGIRVNVPLPPRIGDAGFQRIFDDLLFPLAERYHPQLILVSAGYDAHWSDPLAMENLTIAGYGALARTLVTLAHEFCDGRHRLHLGRRLQLARARVTASPRRSTRCSATRTSPIRLAIASMRITTADDIGDYIEQLKGAHRLV